MSRKTDIFEAVLTNPYNHNSFLDFVREFLNDMDIVAPTQYKKVYNNLIYTVNLQHFKKYYSNFRAFLYRLSHILSRKTLKIQSTERLLLPESIPNIPK